MATPSTGANEGALPCVGVDDSLVISPKNNKLISCLFVLNVGLSVCLSGI
jgi:hypothetical protein